MLISSLQSLLVEIRWTQTCLAGVKMSVCILEGEKVSHLEMAHVPLRVEIVSPGEKCGHVIVNYRDVQGAQAHPNAVEIC